MPAPEKNGIPPTLIFWLRNLMLSRLPACCCPYFDHQTSNPSPRLLDPRCCLLEFSCSDVDSLDPFDVLFAASFLTGVKSFITNYQHSVTCEKYERFVCRSRIIKQSQLAWKDCDLPDNRPDELLSTMSYSSSPNSCPSCLASFLTVKKGDGI